VSEGALLFLMVWFVGFGVYAGYEGGYEKGYSDGWNKRKGG
jgi:hypothetical protein